MPWSEEAEKAVLSIMTQDGRYVPEAVQLLRQEQFHHFAHKAIFATLATLSENRSPVGLESLTAELRNSGQLENIGGVAYLSDLYLYTLPSQLTYWADIVREMAQRRDGITFCQKAIAEAASLQQGETAEWSARLVDQSLKLHEQSITTKSAGRDFKEIVLSIVDAESAPAQSGIPLGFPWLDEKTGGAQPGRLIVVAGGTSDGKTALALQMAANLAEAGHPGSIFSLEMPGEEVVQRMISQGARIRSTVWMHRKFEQGELMKFTSYTEQVIPVRIYDELDAIEEIAATIRIDKGRRGIKWAVVDYAQLCSAKREKGDSREREVATISRTMKIVAKNLGITVILLSQLNDEGLLRESRAIGQDADKLLQISTTKNEGERVVKIAKNRGGQRNVKILMEFEGQFFKFREKEEQKDKA